jgi:hypothetical protein
MTGGGGARIATTAMVQMNPGSWVCGGHSGGCSFHK